MPGMPLLKFIPGNKFTTDVVWSGLSFFTLSVCGIIINVLITKFYGADGTGIFNQAVALYLIGGTVASFGLNTSMVKYAADSSGDKHSLSSSLGSAIIPALFFSVPLTLILYSVAIFLPATFINAEVGRAFSILLPAIPFFALSKVLSGFLNGLRRMKIFSVLQTVRWLIILTVVIIMALTSAGLNSCLLSFVAAEIVTTILLFLISFRITGYRLRWSSVKAKEHISFGSKSLITGFIADLNDRLDVLLAGMLISNQAAGVYSFAASIARGLPALGSVVQLNFSPVVSELWSGKNIAVLKKRMSQVFYYNLMIFVPLTLLAPAAYHIFLKFFVHDSHILSGEMIFLILAAGMGSGSIFYFLGSFLSMCGMPKQQLRLTFWLCIFNVSATTLLTILFGITGTAAGTAAGFIFLILLLQWYISRHTGINMFKTLLSAKSYAAK
jgi:O-antigen/teichoic acid export membrane protein